MSSFKSATICARPFLNAGGGAHLGPAVLLGPDGGGVAVGHRLVPACRGARAQEGERTTAGVDREGCVRPHPRFWMLSSPRAPKGPCVPRAAATFSSTSAESTKSNE